jgi:hypothetical protein
MHILRRYGMLKSPDKEMWVHIFYFSCNQVVFLLVWFVN